MSNRLGFPASTPGVDVRARTSDAEVRAEFGPMGWIVEPRHVLLIDPRTELADRLRPLLTPHALSIRAVGSSDEADAFIQDHPVAVVLLGAMLPNRSGVQYLKLLRSYPATRDLPIILLGRRESDIDIAIGLEAGADDYVPSPISVVELQRRILAVQRRCEGPVEMAEVNTQHRVGQLVFDHATRRAKVGDEILPLRPVELDLLAQLLSAPGRVFTRQQLVRLVCESEDVLERVIDVHVRRLRACLAQAGAEPMIETVRGIGYRLLEGSPDRSQVAG